MSVALESFVEAYKYQLGSLEVWPPYWINWDESPYYLNAPYRGKASPGQLRRMIERFVISHPSINDPIELRSALKVAGIGIDCSGFVYHILSAYLRRLGLGRLGSYLSVPTVDVVKALKQYPERAQNSKLDLNQPTVNMLELCREWRKNPVMLANVQRLIEASDRIEVVSEIMPADMIKMTSKNGDHIGIVVRVGGAEIVYVASDDDNATPGGITYHSVVLVNPSEQLEAQIWDQKHIFNPASTNDGIYRLKVLA
jgi:CheY-like chemotaxis protein